ncbi:KAT8 regulatory NSL complex subunit 1 [Astyanax mexicanus]|uniref:KAT8 regulatory NSL complex subunit 1 n=1 Tax=Astyanax mexicanus TaxID=7994 RepID=UPI0020CADE32|nr:KAT8 regulatory NSL complex subunit 1 [Astyanax mexicanus]
MHFHYRRRRRAEISAAGPGGARCGCVGARGGGGAPGSARGSALTEARDHASTVRWKAREDAVLLLANGARAAAASVSARVTQEDGGSASQCCCCCGAAGRVGIDQSGGTRRRRMMNNRACLSTTNIRPPDTAACKRRACTFTHSAKRVCCGSSNGSTDWVGEAGTCPQRTIGAGGGASRVEAAQHPSPLGDGNGNGPSRGRVRLYRVRSFITAGPITCHHHQKGVNGGGGGSGELDLQVNGQHPAGRDRSGCRSGSAVVQAVEEAAGEAGQRQAALEERTERLWRRLQAVQVRQVERHVAQQLGGLRQRAAGRRGALELGRMARSCGEVLRSAEAALDSDHTASSSGGSSDSEEEEEEEEGGRGRQRVGSSSLTPVHMSMEWQWTRDRAWLGSRWVWLQAQVSELEYRIRALTDLYTHLRQGKVGATHSVPETPLRAPRPPRGPPDCRSSGVGDPLRKKQMINPAPSSQAPPCPPSSAARSRPLLRQRRHKLIRIERCAALASKAVTSPCCCQPPVVCVLCGISAACPPAGQDQSGRVRRRGLDPCVHPVLSMPSDFSLALNFGTPPLAGPQSHSGVQRCGSTAVSPWLRGRSQGPQRAGRARRRLVCPRPPNTLPPLLSTAGGSSCRSQRGVFSPGFLPQRVSDLPPLPATPPATDTPTQPLRRRRGESSFDIDNLVMPLGLAGLGARVQKLQYKEIITPSWRELDSVCGVSVVQVGAGSHPKYHSDVPHQPNGVEAGGECEVEDLSDGVFLKRHAVCESRERSRWGSWARRRRRGRSSSSCPEDGKSSRGTEQEPCSPNPRQRHLTGGDASPCSPLCSGADDPFYHTEEKQQAVQPWERRLFPLLEAELRWLQDEEEDEDVCTASARSQSTDSGISVGSLELSPRTPQPHQQHPDTEPTCPQTLTCKLAVQSTQDSASLLLCLAPPTSLSSPRNHAITHHANHRASRTSASPF